MAQQYNRQLNIVIQNDTTTLEIKNLRVVFLIEKTLRGFPNLAEIEIYNLSRESRADIQNEFDFIILNAGYYGNVKTVFNGDIKNVTHKKNGVDTITTIYAADGQQSFDQSFSSFTLGKGANLKDILTTINKDFKKAALGIIKGVDLAQQKFQSYSVAKPSRNVLDELAQEYNFSWSIEQGVIKIISNTTTDDIEFEISASTGMINSPSITEIGADVEFLLNPEVLPGGVINIISEGADINLPNLQFRNRATIKTEGSGRYKVIKVTHQGDNYSDTWSSTVVGQTL